MALAVSLWLAAAPAGAKVFLSKSEALAWAFPDADSVQSKSHVLTAAQEQAIQSLARAQLDSKLVTLYTAKRGDEVLGYAYIDLHTVRTLPAAFLVVMAPDGHVARLRVLAFYEPQEYRPSERWLGQFEGKECDAPLRLRSDIHGIAGSTLSARAITSGVRRAMAFHRVLVQGEG